MFGLYLDLQKNKDIDELSSDEVKGRWKSFIGKWNRAELSEGWYDPTTKTKADNSAIATDRSAQKDGLEVPPSPPSRRKQTAQTVQPEPELKQQHNGGADEDEDGDDDGDDDDDNDDYGPALPANVQLQGRGPGPAIPSLEDLQHRHGRNTHQVLDHIIPRLTCPVELTLEDAQSRREDMLHRRKMDRKAQKEQLEEIIPRAEPGTRERQLEKKQETSAVNRAFREARSPGAEEVGEKDLMGDDEDGIKRKIKEMDKKKSERELRKEEVLRAREAEREERIRGLREKEDKTMEVLRAIARERFGANC